MRQLLRLVPLASFIMGLALACAPDERDYVGEYLTASDSALREICECDYNNPLVLLGFGYAGFDSVESCEAEVGIDSAERGCVSGLFADEPTDYSAVLDCRADAAGRASACLNGKTCTDTARIDCFSQYGDEIEDCPDLPNDIETKLNDCLRN